MIGVFLLLLLFLSGCAHVETNQRSSESLLRELCAIELSLAKLIMKERQSGESLDEVKKHNTSDKGSEPYIWFDDLAENAFSYPVMESDSAKAYMIHFFIGKYMDECLQSDKLDTL